MNYYTLLSNEQILIAINLYLNYQKMQRKDKIITKKYYIINKNFMKDIKSDNKFKKIYELMVNNKITENNKTILSVIKQLSDDELKIYINNNKLKRNNIFEIKPNLIQKKYFDKEEKSIFIYDDFEIIERYIIEKILDNINQLDDCYLECKLIEGKIIIDYPDNLNNKKYISVIGIINDEKTFVTEYILIYNESFNKKKHIELICDKLTNYLEGLHLCNNNQPIINSFQEIGIIYNCKSNNSNNQTNIKNYPKENNKKVKIEKEYNTPYIKNNCINKNNFIPNINNESNNNNLINTKILIDNILTNNNYDSLSCRNMIPVNNIKKNNNKNINDINNNNKYANNNIVNNINENSNNYINNYDNNNLNENNSYYINIPNNNNIFNNINKNKNYLTNNQNNNNIINNDNTFAKNNININYINNQVNNNDNNNINNNNQNNKNNNSNLLNISNNNYYYETKNILNINNNKKMKSNSIIKDNNVYNNNNIENYNNINNNGYIDYNNNINNNSMNSQNITYNNNSKNNDNYNNSNLHDNYNNNNSNINNNSNNSNVNIINNHIFNHNNINDEYNLEYRTNKKKIKDHFSYAPKIILQYIEPKSFINNIILIILQCFCHIEKFIDYFKYHEYVINIVKNDKNNLTASFKLLIEKLWPNNYNDSNLNQYISLFYPDEFINKINKIEPSFEEIHSNYEKTKKLINIIFNKLHKELNKVKISNNNNSLNIDETNQQLMLNNFCLYFSNNHKSIISDLFYGINCKITKCNSCNKINSYNYQIYNLLEFSLEDLYKFKYQRNISSNNINDSINIYDCFTYYQSIHLITGANSFCCKLCKMNSNATICTSFTTLPNILILLLNRGQEKCKIDFYENLDLNNFIQNKSIKFSYKLIGVISYNEGINVSSNYNTYCRDPITDKWSKYDKNIINDVNDFNEVINSINPFLLLYQLIN